VLSVGLAPGLTNVLAASLLRRHPDTTRLDLHVVLGTGERHGTEAIAWTMANLDRPFSFVEDGAPRAARGMRGASRVTVPGRRHPLPARRFNFPEQRSLARTVAVPSVASWLAFDRPSATVAVGAAAAAGAGRLLARRPAIELIARSAARLRVGSDICAVVVEATGPTGARQRRAITGRQEARITALVAARVADIVLEGGIAAGVHHLEAVVDPDAFLRDLAACTQDLALPDVESRTTRS
jgi:hypothetical protein